MSDKYLTVKEWQKFAKDQKGVYKDAAMLKALGAAEKAADAPAVEQIKILEGLETAGRALLAQHRDDKKLKSYLEDVYKPLKKYREEAEKAQAKDAKAEAKAAAKPAAGADDEDDGPAWLDPKVLLKQLNLCKADPERTVNFAFVDGKDKAPGMVVLSPKVAAPALFKKLAAELDVKTGAFGSAWVDGTELMLQLDKPLAGLVKKMRTPIKASGFKASKIILWNADGTVFESEATAEDAPAESAAAEFAARLTSLVPRVAAAAASKEGQAAKLLASEAGVFARKADFAAAHANLDKIERLLTSGGEHKANPAGAPAGDTNGSEAPKGERVSPQVAFTQTRLAWDRTRKFVQEELRRLERAIIDAFEDDAVGPAIAAGTRKLYRILDTLDERLIDKLDDALNASDLEQRASLHRDARAVVSQYLEFLEKDALMADIDDNGFIETSIRSTVEQRLRAIDQVLGRSLN